MTIKTRSLTSAQKARKTQSTLQFSSKMRILKHKFQVQVQDRRRKREIMEHQLGSVDEQKVGKTVEKRIRLRFKD